MPFAYNIGIHDASWRNTFGGTIYKTSGSHGCINVPPAFAEQLFNAVDKGTPVVAYYREAVTLTNNAAKMSNAYSYVAPRCCAIDVDCLVFLNNTGRRPAHGEFAPGKGAPERATSAAA